MESSVIQLRVSARSEPRSVGSAAVRYFNEGRKVELTAVGSTALNKAIQACIHMNRFLTDRGLRARFDVREEEFKQRNDVNTGYALRIHVFDVSDLAGGIQ